MEYNKVTKQKIQQGSGIMKMTIHGKQLVITDAIKNYAETKLGRVEKYHDGIIELAINLSAVKLKTGNYHTAEVLAYLGGSTVKASCTDADLYAAIDGVSDVLEGQLKKHKDKIRTAVQSREPMIRKVKYDPETNTVEKEAAVNVVKVYLPPKPMDVEEAILQLEILNRAFFPFTNAETGEMNIVYKRKDGDYGHIEPLKR